MLKAQNWKLTSLSLCCPVMHLLNCWEVIQADHVNQDSSMPVKLIIPVTFNLKVPCLTQKYRNIQKLL